jgi:hypothetical protein
MQAVLNNIKYKLQMLEHGGTCSGENQPQSKELAHPSSVCV